MDAFREYRWRPGLLDAPPAPWWALRRWARYLLGRWRRYWFPRRHLHPVLDWPNCTGSHRSPLIDRPPPTFVPGPSRKVLL